MVGAEILSTLTGVGASEGNVLAFACWAHNYKLHDVLILPSCTKDMYKKRMGEYTSVNINFLVEVIIPLYEKQVGIAVRYTAVSIRVSR